MNKEEIYALYKSGRRDFSGVDLRYMCLAGANLAGADLAGADLLDARLSGANLASANLTGARLAMANLFGSNMSGSNMSGAGMCCAVMRDSNLASANLTGARLAWAKLDRADLTGARLAGTDLRCAHMRNTNLTDADLTDADLTGADLRGSTTIDTIGLPPLVCPDVGQFECWKKCANGVLVRLRVPADARRSSATTRKCRAEYVEVLEVIDADVGINLQDETTEYRVGTIVRCHEWCPDRWTECAGGIHFFLSREEAEEYIL